MDTPTQKSPPMWTPGWTNDTTIDWQNQEVNESTPLHKRHRSDKSRTHGTTIDWQNQQVNELHNRQSQTRARYNNPNQMIHRHNSQQILRRCEGKLNKNT